MNIIGRKWFFFFISLLVILPGVSSMVQWGIKPAIDFTGGTLIEFSVVPASSSASLTSGISHDEIRSIAKSKGVEVATVQSTGEDTFLLRTKPINHEQNLILQEEFGKKYGNVEEVRFETVGPTIGRETTVNAVKAVLFASLAIVVYIAWAFRKIPRPYSPWSFGICAVIALIHDVIVVVGVFSLFGHFLNVEVDSLFITALLTIMGFSVHDTIVVFDRIRENLQRMPGVPFARIVNDSIVQTLVRSLSTSLTVIFALSALLLFGGESIRWFIVALLIGIVSGTFSSIFNASPLLVVWEQWRLNRKK